MAFENPFKRTLKEEKMDTPEQREADRKDKRDKIAFAIGAPIALAGAIAAGHVDDLPHMPQNNASVKMDLKAEDLQAPKQMDGKGTTVELKDGHAVITMAPPGTEKPVNIDLREKPVDIDLHEKVIEMNPPE